MGMYSMFTGGALERCAIGALGIMPYISATIIIQLLSAVVPRLSKLMREEGGRAKIIQYGRYLTAAPCIGQGIVHDVELGECRRISSKVSRAAICSCPTCASTCGGFSFRPSSFSRRARCC